MGMLRWECYVTSVTRHQPLGGHVPLFNICALILPGQGRFENYVKCLAFLQTGINCLRIVAAQENKTFEILKTMKRYSSLLVLYFICFPPFIVNH